MKSFKKCHVLRKNLLIALLITLPIVAIFAQSEHYDTQPRFPYQATALEKQMLPHWYQNTRNSNPPTAPVSAIAEFQPMGGVMIAYPLGIPVNLIAELSFITQVKVLVYPASDSITARTYFEANGVNTNNVSFWVINHDSYWTRDYGPWFILDGNNQIGVVDFTYNRPQRPHDDAALISVTNKLGLERYEMPIVHTGGNYMTDGYGIAASTTLLLDENPNLNTTSILDITHNYLGINDYMLLDDPLGDYIEHIDCWGKFLDVDKVLIAQVPTSDSRYNDYETVASIFENAFTPWGNHYQVFRIFAPGQYNVTPFTNSLILNDHVFVPVCGTQWDNDAITVYQNAMPGYTIVPIVESSYTPWQNTDALHCRTHELADPNMLYIKHYPLFNNQNITDSTRISAEIKALSGQSLISDSVLLYYRINHGTWQNLPLYAAGNDLFETSLPSLQSGDEVDYYIFAKDQSGHREKHPYIGAADPHHFTIGTVGVTDHKTKHSEIALFPNPCENQCFLQSKTALQTVQVYDLFGKLIYSGQYDDFTTKIDVSSWKPGLYNAVITDENNSTFYKKIVKR